MSKVNFLSMRDYSFANNANELPANAGNEIIGILTQRMWLEEMCLRLGII